MGKYGSGLIVASLKRQFLNLLGNKTGNVAMIFALLALPVMGAVGFAVDYSRVLRIQSNMQNAADSAALAAVAIKEELNDDQVKQLVQRFFVANGGTAEVSRKTRVRGRETARDVIVTAAVNADLYLLPVLTGDKFQKVRVISRARKTDVKLEGVEIALVVDTTHSMDFGTSWRDTSSAINDTLRDIESATDAGDLHITLVPFTDRVNIGTQRTGWLSKTDSLDDWEGCVEVLESAKQKYPYYIELGQPGGAFLPSVPKYWTGIMEERPKNVDRACPKTISGPTTKLSDIRNAMSELGPNNNATGRFDDALVWGWRTVAKEWRGNWNGMGAYPSKDEDVQKIVAFFSDGHTNINKFEMEKQRGEFGNNNGSKTLFSHFVNVCNRMKADGIEVFVFHAIGNAAAEPYFRDCAEENYFKVTSNDELEEGLLSLAERGSEGAPRLIK